MIHANANTFCTSFFFKRFTSLLFLPREEATMPSVHATITLLPWGALLILIGLIWDF
jgi:hypothetical protein